MAIEVTDESDICSVWYVGNTDTQFYWNLTKHIYRYTHLGTEDAYNGAHTVNEGASL